MACDYHNRIDFRALDVIVDAITKASPAELDAAIKSCAESGRDSYTAPIRKTLWRAFAAMLRLYKRKYNKPAKLWQQTVTEITRGL